MKFMPLISIILCFIISMVTPANAASLTGDNLVKLTLKSSTGIEVAFHLSVKTGVESDLFGVAPVDLNAGVDQDIFVWGSQRRFGGVLSNSPLHTVTLTLSYLNFDTGFSGITFLTNLVHATVVDQSDTMVALRWAEVPLGGADFLSFRFNSVPSAAVPLPASLPMLALAYGGLGLVARRRRA